MLISDARSDASSSSIITSSSSSSSSSSRQPRGAFQGLALPPHITHAQSGISKRGFSRYVLFMLFVFSCLSMSRA